VLSRAYKLGETGDLQIGIRLSCFHGAYSGARRGTLHPDCGQSQRLGGNDIMKDALSDVQYPVGWNTDAA